MFKKASILASSSSTVVSQEKDYKEKDLANMSGEPVRGSAAIREKTI